jgi:NMD protein affecting ribosome stability and mRNA decay
MAEEKKFYCPSCGRQISKEQYENNDGLCEECAWNDKIEDEDSDLILGGGW